MTIEEIISGPYFNSPIAMTTFDLNDIGIKFNTQRTGIGSFAELRNADYGPGFRMPIMPELISLVYASLKEKDYEITKNLIKTLKNNWLTGDTGILYASEGIFFQDNPTFVNNKISMNQESLESRLGKKEEKRVVFSDDEKIRFTPYGFKTDEQIFLELSKNPGIIAFAGSLENAEKLSEASQYWNLNPGFYSLNSTDLLKIRLPGLGSDNFDGRLLIIADGKESTHDGVSLVVRYSFGVSKI